MLGAATTIEIEVSDDIGPVLTPEVRLNGQLQPADGSLVEVVIDVDGGYLLVVVASDSAGNTTRVERSFVLDRGGCALADLEPANGSSAAGGAVTVRGEAGEAAGVEARIPVAGSDPLVFPADLADGTFVVGGVPLPEIGDNLIEVVCIDATGGESVESLTVFRLADGDGPTIEITAPPIGAWVDASTVLVEGTVSDAGAHVNVNGVGTPVTDAGDGTGTFRVEPAACRGSECPGGPSG